MYWLLAAEHRWRDGQDKARGDGLGALGAPLHGGLNELRGLEIMTQA